MVILRFEKMVDTSTGMMNEARSTATMLWIRLTMAQRIRIKKRVTYSFAVTENRRERTR